MKSGSHYVFRSTTDKLEGHVNHIVESGDTVLGEPVFCGGRDWVLLCRKGGPGSEPVVGALIEATQVLRELATKLGGLEERIAAGVRSGVSDGASR